MGEHKDLTPSSAAALAGEYVLARKDAISYPVKFQNYGQQQNFNVSKEAVVETAQNDNKRATRPKDPMICGHCHKRGHLIANCFKLKRDNRIKSTPKTDSKLGLFVSTFPPTSRKDKNVSDVFAPFVSTGYIALPGNREVRVPVNILRDTAASQSFVLESVLPFSEKSYAGENILVQGFEMGFVNVPLHEVALVSDLVAGDFKMGVRRTLPIKNVQVLLGNDVMGGMVFPSPVVTNSPISQCPDDLNENFPGVFQASVVTRAMAQRAKETQVEDESIGLCDTFFVKPSLDVSDLPTDSASLSKVPKVSVSREHLIKEQKNDPSLASLFVEALSEVDIEHSPHGYFLREGVLMRKWRPLTASAQDEWRVFYQIVVPVCYRGHILSVAHDHHLSGHLGVTKTLDRITRYFYWPGVNREDRKSVV